MHVQYREKFIKLLAEPTVEEGVGGDLERRTEVYARVQEDLSTESTNNLPSTVGLSKKFIVGVDEAGRGPLAGPVVAAAVILNPNNSIIDLQDSKKLTDKKRRKLVEIIQHSALAYAIGRADVQEIEQLNIHHATLLAMQRAVLALPQGISIDRVIIDGLFCPKLSHPCEAIVGGDISQPVISAASILAKVFRDNEMIHLDQLYPGYGFAIHKGYPTKMHTEAIARLGITNVHRRSYGPVKALLSKT